MTYPDYIFIRCLDFPYSISLWTLFCIRKLIKVFFTNTRKKHKMGVSQKPFLVAEEGSKLEHQEHKEHLYPELWKCLPHSVPKLCRSQALGQTLDM